MSTGEAVSVDRLAEAVWGNAAPRSADKGIQNAVLRLRKQLGATVIERRAGGYVLRLGPADVDASRFEDLVRTGRRVGADGDRAAAIGALTQALALWRGPVLPELGDWPTGRVEAVRLEELRRSAEEELAEHELALGRHHELIARLEKLAMQ